MGDPEGSISVPCAVCGQSHLYSYGELAPWPPGDGEKRTVPCRTDDNRLSRLRAGDYRVAGEVAYGSPIMFNKITFRRKNRDVNPFT